MTTTRLAQLVRDNPGPVFCLLLFAAVLAANAPVVAGLGKTWWISYSEMGHGFLAPPLALYIAWLKKDHLRELPVAGAPAGLFLTISAMLLILVSHLAQWIFFSQIGLWLLLVGAIWYLLGWQWLKALRFSIFLLALAIPPPSFLYTRVTFEMQLLASRMGELGLEGLGYSVLREGNILHLPGERLSVAEACSGIRSLVTLVFFRHCLWLFHGRQ
ncbi:exosortase/archaeosortase family protein [Oscillatoria amoena NRMC-F 0135]|nr:exosortase/archaeosortase family protein [Oscillatoria amoena NRMC-F 0135]